jgi:hypothetical protein
MGADSAPGCLCEGRRRVGTRAGGGARGSPAPLARRRCPAPRRAAPRRAAHLPPAASTATRTSSRSRRLSPVVVTHSGLASACCGGIALNAARRSGAHAAQRGGGVRRLPGWLRLALRVLEAPRRAPRADQGPQRRRGSGDRGVAACGVVWGRPARPGAFAKQPRVCTHPSKRHGTPFHRPPDRPSALPARTRHAMAQAAPQQQQMKEVIDAKGAQDVSVGAAARGGAGGGGRGRGARRARCTPRAAAPLRCAVVRSPAAALSPGRVAGAPTHMPPPPPLAASCPSCWRRTCSTLRRSSRPTARTPRRRSTRACRARGGGMLVWLMALTAMAAAVGADAAPPLPSPMHPPPGPAGRTCSCRRTSSCWRRQQTRTCRRRQRRRAASSKQQRRRPSSRSAPPAARRRPRRLPRRRWRPRCRRHSRGSCRSSRPSR